MVLARREGLGGRAARGWLRRSAALVYDLTVDEPLIKFTSHIDGKNADVEIYVDRVEWTQKSKMLRRGNHEMIPIKAISSVSQKRDGLHQAVSVICSGNTIEFRVGKKEADTVKALLTDLILGKHTSQLPPPP